MSAKLARRVFLASLLASTPAAAAAPRITLRRTPTPAKPPTPTTPTTTTTTPKTTTTTTPTAPAPTPARVTAVSGLFTGGSLGNTPEPIAGRVQHFDEWLYSGARKTTMFLDFAAHDTWTSASGSLALCNNWMPICPPGQLVLSWPLVTAEKNGKAGFAQIVAGGQDALLARLCSVLTSRSMGNAVIRLGWEMNGDWYPWGAAQDANGYIAAFRHVVDFCRAQPKVKFKWVWNVNVGLQKIAWENCFPGTGYVDYVGVDIYDMYWGDPTLHTQAARWDVACNGPYGLKAIAAFARSVGKPLCIPEWGVGRAGPVGGGIENPDWIDFMADFIADPQNNVAWHAYWNRDAGSGYEGQIFPTNLRPLTAARYKARFGG